MASPDTLRQITQIYREGEILNGCTDFVKVAAEIQKKTGFSHPEEIVYAARRISRPDHLFAGAIATAQDLMNRGDQVTVWTQGHPLNQLYKIAGSGISSARRAFSNTDRRRFSVTAQMDKVTDIDQTVNRMRDKGVEKVVVVDDKAGNIKDVKARLRELKAEGKIPSDLDISVIWARYGVYKDKAPSGMTLEDFLQDTQTIGSISDIRDLKTPKGKTGWLLDFDNTLFRTADYNQELYAQAGHIVDGIDHILPAQIGVAAGISGTIKSANLMKHGGMSGSNITLVDTGDKQVVVKHNFPQPDRVKDDIRGYHFLSKTPLAEKMPQPHIFDEEKGFLVLPHLSGRTLREALAAGNIDSNMALTIYQQLLDIKKQWWATQSKQPFEGQVYKSMQRKEWAETQQMIPEAIRQMAYYFGVSETALQNLPLRMGGRKLPSLADMMLSVDQLLQQPPKYLIGVHGDATGSNIIFNTEKNNWSLIDAEWSGLGDPAESYVRMSKHRSSTTASSIQVDGIGVYEGAVGIRMKGEFSQVADNLHQYVAGRSKEFSHVLKDPDFLRRIKTYATGSFLREIALSTLRGNVESGLLAMVMAGESSAGPILAHHIAA